MLRHSAPTISHARLPLGFTRCCDYRVIRFACTRQGADTEIPSQSRRGRSLLLSSDHLLCSAAGMWLMRAVLCRWCLYLLCAVCEARTRRLLVPDSRARSKDHAVLPFPFHTTAAIRDITAIFAAESVLWACMVAPQWQFSNLDQGHKFL